MHRRPRGRHRFEKPGAGKVDHGRVHREDAMTAANLVGGKIIAE